jgi:putative ABC transport system permease protein
MGDLLQDLRCCLRPLQRNPVFAVTAVLTLALGIGANVAVFSVVHTVLLKPLPYPDSERLVRIWETNPQQSDALFGTSWSNLLEWQARSRTFVGLGAYRIEERPLPLVFGQVTERVTEAAVSDNLFRLLGIRPAAGHIFAPEDEFALMLSYGFWMRRLGGDPAVVGKPFDAQGWSRYTVAGILPPDFALVPDVDVWRVVKAVRTSRPDRHLSVVARLKPGASVEAGRAEMRTLARQLASESPAANRGWTVVVRPLRETVAAQSRPALVVFAVATSLVLLLVCANLAILLLTRADGRRKEIAIRLALGGSQLQLARPLVLEASVLAVIGTLLASWLAHEGLHLLLALNPTSIPRLREVAPDSSVIAYAIGVCLLTITATSLAPVHQAFKTDLSRALKGREGTRPGARAMATRRLLVGAELVLAVVLLAGAGLLLRSYARLRGLDLGFRPEELLLSQVLLPIPDSFAQAVAAPEQLLARIRDLPGVRSAALTTSPPLTGTPLPTFVSALGLRRHVLDRAQTNPTSDVERRPANLRAVSCDYFRTTGVSLVAGRVFTQRDRLQGAQLGFRGIPQGQGVAVVSERLAKHLWPDGLGLGQVIRLQTDFVDSREVVGVVRDVRAAGPRAEPGLDVYVPLSQSPAFSMTLLVRTSGDPGAVAPLLRRRILEFDRNVALSDVRKMEDLVGADLLQPRFHALLLGTFAVIGLLVGAVGIYGTLALTLAKRTPEIGIRIALGAAKADVIRLVVREGMALALPATVLGLLVALGLGRGLSALLFGVSATDAVTFSAVPSLVVSVAVLASYLPAHRAARVDPVVALRQE